MMCQYQEEHPETHKQTLSDTRGKTHRSEVHVNVIVIAMLICILQEMLQISIDTMSSAHIEAKARLATKAAK